VHGLSGGKVCLRSNQKNCASVRTVRRKGTLDGGVILTEENRSIGRGTSPTATFFLVGKINSLKIFQSANFKKCIFNNVHIFIYNNIKNELEILLIQIKIFQ
jgi:Zn-dependent alcohol dehydrogenase